MDRGYLDLSLPAQTYKVASEKTAIQQAAGQMKMIAPIVDLSKGVGYETAQDYDLNLEFVNLYTMVKVAINSSNIPEGATPKLEKITLNAKAGETTTKGFVKKAHAALEAIAGPLKANVVTPNTTSKQLEADEVAKAKEALEKLLAAAGNTSATVGDVTVADQISTIYDQTGIDSDDDKYGPAVLSVEGDLPLTSTKATELYILVPKGTYNNGLELTVVTSEGTYTKPIEKQDGKDLTFGNDIQRISANLNFKLDGTGNVKLPESFDINNNEDWTNSVDFLTSHAIAYINKTITFNLKENIEIPALPIFKLEISGNKTLTLTGDYTINEENADQFEATGVTLGVKAGATLTLNADADAFAAINNEGTLKVNADQSKKITNLGTMTVGDNATLEAGLDNGKAKTATTPAVAGNVTVAAGKTLTIASVELDNIEGTVTVNKDSKLVVNNASDNKGTITNNGEISGSGTITNTGTIDNFGALKATVTNTNGNVIAEKGSKGTGTITNGTVEVKDVTTFKETQNGDDKYTFISAVVTTLVNNVGEYKAADDANAKITNITLNGGEWKLKSAIGGDTTKEIAVPVNAKGLTLKGAKLSLEVAMAEKAIIVEGTSSITAATALSITKANLTVAKDATLNVGNNVTVNAKDDYTGFTAEIFGTLNVEAGAAMYFATANVGAVDNSNAKVSVKGNTPAVEEPGIFAVNTTTGFVNWGTVESLKGTNEVPAVGKVTMPTNQTDEAGFKGNATESLFS